MRPDYVKKDAGYETPCWMWLKWRSSKGYGKKWYQGRNRWAHRVYYEKAFGVELSPDQHLDHKCRNTGCVNPNHLEIVTNLENQRRRSRLTESVVAEIRALYPKLSQNKLAERFGMSRSNIRDIVNRKTWVDGTTG